MANKQYSTEFKVQIIKEVKQINNVSFVARKHNICSKNIYNWIRSDSLKNNTSNAQDNKKIKKELEEAKLELLILKDLLKKTYQV